MRGVAITFVVFILVLILDLEYMAHRFTDGGSVLRSSNQVNDDRGMIGVACSSSQSDYKLIQ